MGQDSEKRRLQKRAFALCRRAQIENSDRIELATALLDLGEGEIKSYNDLDADGLKQLTFALRSWEIVEELRRISGAKFDEALGIVREAYSELDQTSQHRLPEHNEEESLLRLVAGEDGTHREEGSMPRAAKKKAEEIVESPVSVTDKLKAIMATKPEDLLFMTGTTGRWPEEKIIRTGSIGLDRAIGIGGWPKGRIIEVYGPWSSGKTSLSLTTLACAQRSGVAPIFIDAENAFDPNYAKKLGVDVNAMLVNQPDGLENAIDLMLYLMANGPVLPDGTPEGLFIVVDSVAQLEPTEVMDGDAGKEVIGLKARRWSQNLTKLTKAARQSNSTIILLNQEREKINPKPWEEKKTVPGGTAIKFGTSLRLRLSRKVHKREDGEGVEGQTVFVEIQKNKVGSPYKKASFYLPAGRGIDSWQDVVTECFKAGFVLEDTKRETVKDGSTVETKGKGWFTLPLTDKRWEAIRADDPEAQFKAEDAISVYREKEFSKTLLQYPTLIELLEQELLDSLNDSDGGNVADAERPEDDEDEIDDDEVAVA